MEVRHTIKTRKYVELEVAVDEKNHVDKAQFMIAVSRLSGYLDGQSFTDSDRKETERWFGKILDDLSPF